MRRRPTIDFLIGRPAGRVRRWGSSLGGSSPCIYPSSSCTPTTGSIQRRTVASKPCHACANSCLYFCDTSLPRFFSLSLSLSVLLQSRKCVQVFVIATVVRFLNREAALEICSCEFAIQLRARSVFIHVLYNRIQNRRLQNHGTISRQGWQLYCYAIEFEIHNYQAAIRSPDYEIA